MLSHLAFTLALIFFFASLLLLLTATRAGRGGCISFTDKSSKCSANSAIHDCKCVHFRWDRVHVVRAQTKSYRFRHHCANCQILTWEGTNIHGVFCCVADFSLCYPRHNTRLPTVCGLTYLIELILIKHSVQVVILLCSESSKEEGLRHMLLGGPATM